MSAYFVTSTGTDIGKTFVTAGLIRYLREAGQSVHALKPVVSGYDSSVVETSDPAVLLNALGRAVSADEIEHIAPWRFRAPLAPDIAAVDVDLYGLAAHAWASSWSTNFRPVTAACSEKAL